MAITAGQGNPDWTEEETILALDVYLSSGRKAIGKNDPAVIELSDLLQRIPWPEGTTRNDKFRNNQGVSMKVLNLRAVELGRGLRTTIMDRRVYGMYGEKPDEVSRLAAQIRAEVASNSTELRAELQLDNDYDTPYPDGRLFTAIHKRRERNPKLRAKLLQARRKQGALHCEMCTWGQQGIHADYLTAALEAHHLVPLSTREAEETRLADLTLLCANCHRLIHRAIATFGRWLTVVECRDIAIQC